MNLSVRQNPPEVMDDPDLPEPVYRRCLADLAALNRLTLTHRATLRFLARHLTQPAAILDIAYGQGDLLRAIATRNWQTHLSGIDLNPRAATEALAIPAAQPIHFHTGDVFAYTPVPSPDFILTSQFPHHLPNADIIRLLRWMDANAAKGWIITDLHRHFLPYYGFPLLAFAMRWHRIVRRDGTASIARGFTRQDWQSLLAQAGIEAKITWHFPFRHSIARLK